ncbi:MAG: hypothetical protein IKW47_00255 [Alistipes sp.]|nr:hypothetical protein [Alistipes sp.]
MLKKIAKCLVHILLWALLIVAIVWAIMLSKSHRNTMLVCGTDVEVVGGGSNPLISSEDINLWLKEQGLHPDGSILSKVDIAAIESMVASHSAVARVNTHINYEGRVMIHIEQREPIARLRMSGYDMYLTADGYVLPVEGCNAAHVKVVTGDYKPFFDSCYAGCVATIVRDSIAALELYVEQLEKSKLPHYKRHNDNNAALRAVRRSLPKRGLFESQRSHEILEIAYKDSLSKATELHSINSRAIEEDLADIDRAIERALHLKHSLCRQVEEFEDMVAMIRHIISDSFLDADIAQIVATGGGANELQLAVIPRVANVTVDLGTTENLERKLATLRRFYDKGLSRIGWDRYSVISLRYDGQVVCK